nr:unnamed protein product [Digitaria exilis]
MLALHFSRKPVMRSTAVRTDCRSRPLSVRPCPTHTDEEATTRPSEHRRLAASSRWGGTNAGGDSSLS